MWTFTAAQGVQETQKPLELPLTGQSEQKIDAISMQVDEKITQFHQNPIFKAASGGLVLGRGIIAPCSRLQLPSLAGQGAASGDPEKQVTAAAWRTPDPNCHLAGREPTFATTSVPSFTECSPKPTGVHGTCGENPEASSPGPQSRREDSSHSHSGGNPRFPLFICALCLGPKLSHRA